MGATTGIGWTEATWNPVVGCSHVSDGCRNCYAEELHRTRLSGVGAYPEFRPWTAPNAEHNVTLVPDKLDQPLRWREPRTIFVNSMSDLFHELVPDEYIGRVFDVMAEARRHTFQVLTKRPERMAVALTNRRDYLGMEPLPNVWLGTSIESRRHIDRADHLRATPAAVRFVSAEPLLGPLVGLDAMASERAAADEVLDRVSGLPPRRGGLDLAGIDWLIVGGESGPKYRPMRVGWVRDLRDACRIPCAYHAPMDVRGCSFCDRGRTAFFFKQDAGRRPGQRGRFADEAEWPREWPGRLAPEPSQGALL